MSKVSREKVDEELEKVIDPEIGVPIVEMNLVDKVEISEKGDLLIEFHLTTPFCPPVFALKMAQDIKERLSKIEGVRSVRVQVKDHYMADYINKTINE
jgi:metal-sulfur cluster biosynthetic enzyme